MNLVNWELVCMPKKLGGMGVTDLKLFNQALLVKHYWQWFKEDPNLWKPLVTQMGIDQYNIPTSELFTKTLKGTLDFARMSILMRPGNGENIKVWHEDWGFGILKDRLSILHSYCHTDTQTLEEVCRNRNIQSIFLDNLSLEAQQEMHTLQMHLNQVTLQANRRDEAEWKWEANPRFSVKTAYFMMKNAPRTMTHIHRIWKLQTPPRFRVFGWLATLNRILTIDNLRKKGMYITNS